MIRWLLLFVFVVSLVTLLVVRGNHTNVVMEGGRYFVAYKGMRIETSRQEYEAAQAEEGSARWSGLTAWAAVMAMIASVGALGAVQKLWVPRRRK